MVFTSMFESVRYTLSTLCTMETVKKIIIVLTLIANWAFSLDRYVFLSGMAISKPIHFWKCKNMIHPKMVDCMFGGAVITAILNVENGRHDVHILYHFSGCAIIVEYV